jgi:hypothetical protein
MLHTESRQRMLGFLRRILGGVDDTPVVLEAGPESALESQLIHACRAKLGPRPRTLSASEAADFRLRLMPDLEDVFRETHDPMLRILDDNESLRNRGEVVWGQLVQANQILFDPRNAITAPANVIYSTDSFFDGRVEFLARIAHGLFEQKGSIPRDRTLREFVRVITDERERIMRRELPQHYCGGRSVYFTTLFIQPSHLPGNRIARPEFPLLVNFEETESVMVVPARFWPSELAAEWMH